MIASAPALAATLASASVVAVANQAMPRALSRATKLDGKTPMIDDTAVGASSKNASHWESKSGGTVSPADDGTRGPHCSRKLLTFASASGSLAGLGSGIQVFNCNGPTFCARNS